MWLMALGLYGAAKGATLGVGDFRRVPLGTKAVYVLLYPGMNAEAFFRRKAPRRQGHEGRYLLNVVTGAALFWGVARLAPSDAVLLRGWIGMIGLVMLLHFGVLQIASGWWRAAGFGAELLMNEPWRSGSVADFWSARWNRAFRTLSHQFLFQPLARGMGPRAALLVTFGISGLVHDLLISVPAGAGYGLPTAYFLIQAAGLLFERSRRGRRWLRGRERLFAMAMVAGPLPLLFHTAFVMRVFVPFMEATRALPREVLP
jgi:alginate O-acetyltransferase complex protein AlgI